MSTFSPVRDPRTPPAAALCGALLVAGLLPGIAGAVITESGDVSTSFTGIKRIGNRAAGAVDVTGGDRAAAIPPAEIARLPGVGGELSVRERSLLTINPFTLPGVFEGTSADDSWLVVGLEGNGTLSISGGSELAAPRWVPVGLLPGSSGTVAVDGAGSRLVLGGHLDHAVYGLVGGVIPQHAQGFLSIGPRGEGQVSVTDGGRIDVNQVPGSPTLVMGFGVFLGGEIGPSQGGGTGHLRVTGSGSEVAIRGDNATLAVGTLGGDGFDVPGNGTLE
ncbi:MAG: hypothetical protein RLW62_04010, partial [Gammaproteobacteria bacterium]